MYVSSDHSGSRNAPSERVDAFARCVCGNHRYVYCFVDQGIFDSEFDMGSGFVPFHGRWLSSGSTQSPAAAASGALYHEWWS